MTDQTVTVHKTNITNKASRPPIRPEPEDGTSGTRLPQTRTCGHYRILCGATHNVRYVAPRIMWRSTCKGLGFMLLHRTGHHINRGLQGPQEGH